MLRDAIGTYVQCLCLSRPVLAYELWSLSSLFLTNGFFGFINKPVGDYAEAHHLTSMLQAINIGGVMTLLTGVLSFPALRRQLRHIEQEYRDTTAVGDIHRRQLRQHARAIMIFLGATASLMACVSIGDSGEDSTLATNAFLFCYGIYCMLNGLSFASSTQLGNEAIDDYFKKLSKDQRLVFNWMLYNVRALALLVAFGVGTWVHNVFQESGEHQENAHIIALIAILSAGGQLSIHRWLSRPT